MTRHGELVPVGDHQLHAPTRTPLEANVLATAWREHPAVIDAVAGMDSVTVSFDPLHTVGQVLAESLNERRPALTEDWPDLPLVELPVRYGGEDGPDLPALAEAAGLSAEQYVQAHAEAHYRAVLIGFTPGFAYCEGLPADLHTERRAVPRTRVPGGSVAVGAQHCGLYALPGPGGWPIIGRTDTTLFLPDREPPVMLAPGTPVRFVPA